MPNLLTIPRELRGEIYKWGLLDTLASARSRALQRDRKRVAYDEADPNTYYGEESVRYPLNTSLPATTPLLQTSRQLRAELLDTVKLMGPLKYKIDLASREDKDTLYPTWISVPLLSKRVDELEVQLRLRRRKTSSMCSVVGDDEKEYEADTFQGGMALLQRFLERGVYFLSKKKVQKISVGLLAINVDIPEDFMDLSEKEAVYITDRVEAWMRGSRDSEPATEDERTEREDKQFRFLATKIKRMSLRLNGKFRREWDLKEMLEKRDEEARSRAMEADTQQ